MTISQAMNISRESMNNYQQALSVVSHNIANMNVDGYIKLRADFSTNPSYNYGTSVSATVRGLNGATISKITSYADAIAADTARHANSDAAYYNELATLMDSLGEISNELGESGLQAVLGDFFTAAQNLSTNPTDPSARRLFIEGAQNVAAKFNSISTSLNSLQEELVGNWQEPATIESSNLSTDIDIFNKHLERLAEVNKEILIAGNSGSTNGLINEREQILSELSGYMDISVQQKGDNTIQVSIGNTTLVSGAKQVAKLDVAAGDENTPALIQVKTPNNELLYSNINNQIQGGKISAVLDTVNAKDGNITINDMRKQINNLATTFAKEVNDAQLYKDGNTKAMAMGVDAQGNAILVEATEPIFDTTVAINAGTIKVNSKVINNIDHIAAARVDTSVAGYEKNIGNSDNIVQISQLRDKKTMSTVDSVINSTFEGYLTYCAGQLGIQQGDIANKAQTANAINDSAQSSLQSINGVNLDEELADMIKYQRGYEASARLFNTANEIYQILVNLGA